MEPAEFRTALASFVGPDRYRQFVRYLNGEGRWRGRFLYWQEELLARFATSLSSAEMTFAWVEPLLRCCELHGAELAQDPEGLSQRCRGAVTDYTRTQVERFPNTDCGPLIVGHRRDNFRRGLWYCPACRATAAEWNARQTDPSTPTPTAASLLD